MLIKKCIIFLVIALTTSACSITDTFSASNDEQGNKEFRTFTGDTLLDKYSETEQKRLMNKYIEEWEDLKPAITKVIALENELSFALQALENNNPENNAVLSVEELQSLPNSFQQDQQIQPVFNSRNVNGTNINERADSIDAKFASAGSSAPIKLGVAAPLGRSFDNTSTGDGANTDKFSQATEQSQNMIQTQQRLTSNTRCGESRSIANGDDYAIHLASYSKKISANSGQKSFLAKYQNELCEKVAIIKPVEVKGNNYYSLRFGPYLSSQEAQNVCAILRQRSDYCSVSRFDGERVN